MTTQNSTTDTQTTTTPLSPPKPALSVAEVAELTGFSRQTVTKMFEDEPGSW